MVAHRRASLAGSLPGGIPVYGRDLLRARNVIDGPAIVAEMDATTVVGRGQSATVASDGTLWLRRKRR